MTLDQATIASHVKRQELEFDLILWILNDARRGLDFARGARVHSGTFWVDAFGFMFDLVETFHKHNAWKDDRLADAERLAFCANLHFKESVFYVHGEYAADWTDRQKHRQILTSNVMSKRLIDYLFCAFGHPGGPATPTIQRAWIERTSMKIIVLHEKLRDAHGYAEECRRLIGELELLTA